MNIFLKVYIIGAILSPVLWIGMPTIVRICRNAKEIAGELLYLAAQVYGDFISLFKRGERITAPEDFETFYHD